MNQIELYLIILLFYATLALIFISFATVHPKKYLSYISISHILGMLTVTFVIVTKLVYNNWALNGFSSVLFIWSNFMGILAINNLLKRDDLYFYIKLAMAVTVLDFFAFSFMPALSVILHKILLMSIYLYFSYLVMKIKNKSFINIFFAIVLITFSSIQILFGIAFLTGFIKKTSIDSVIYLMQAFSYSICIIFITLEEAHTDFNKREITLREEVEISHKKIQEIYELDRLKSEFIANISHELRTPINILFSSVQLIEAKIPEEHGENALKVRSYLDCMKHNCYRLIKLTNNLIDMSKLEAGFMELNLINTDIVSLIEDITLSAVPFAEKKGIQLEFDTEFEEKMLACDVEKMERIMLNLLSNAVKFSKNGGKINVDMYMNEGQICISIKDEGIGISEKMQETVFNRFVQAIDTFNRENEGSGIGLSLVKSLVELHGGRITLKSKLNEGSNFIIALPDKVIEADEQDTICSREINMKKIEIEFSDI